MEILGWHRERAGLWASGSTGAARHRQSEYIVNCFLCCACAHVPVCPCVLLCPVPTGVYMQNAERFRAQFCYGGLVSCASFSLLVELRLQSISCQNIWSRCIILGLVSDLEGLSIKDNVSS